MSKNEFIPAELFTALNKAARLHRYQRRKGSECIPYINHPIKVAMLLTQCGYSDISLLQAAVLHDVVEDTDYTLEEMAADFSAEVAALVKEMTDDMSLPSKKRKQLQIEHAAELSTGAAKIKIADKICNISDLLEYELTWSRERKLEYVRWAQKVIRHIKQPDSCLLNQFIKIARQAEDEFADA